jgi:hypothetical protein
MATTTSNLLQNLQHTIALNPKPDTGIKSEQDGNV